MNIKITSDSTCDLSKAILEQNNISVIPLTVVKDGQAYQDNVTITPADIFAHVAAGGALCSTTATNIGEYTDFFAPFAAEYDAVVHINIGSGFSVTHQNATLAAQEFDNVITIDSKNLSTGQGLVVLKACQLAQTATDLQQLKAELEAFTDKVEASFIIDKLDYLVKGGRCSGATALGANLLNLKPCIDVRDNKMVVTKKYRGKFDKCMGNYIRERLENRNDLDTTMPLFITQTQVSEECYTLVKNTVAEFSPFKTVYETFAGCTVTCHCGPGTLGILFARK